MSESMSKSKTYTGMPFNLNFLWAYSIPIERQTDGSKPHRTSPKRFRRQENFLHIFLNAKEETVENAHLSRVQSMEG